MLNHVCNALGWAKKHESINQLHALKTSKEKVEKRMIFSNVIVNSVGFFKCTHTESGFWSLFGTERQVELYRVNVSWKVMRVLSCANSVINETLLVFYRSFEMFEVGNAYYRIDNACIRNCDACTKMNNASTAGNTIFGTNRDTPSQWKFDFLE